MGVDLGLLLVLLVVGGLLLVPNWVLLVSRSPGFLVLFGWFLGWFVVGTAGCVVIDSSSSCPVRFGIFIGLAWFLPSSSSSFLPWNMS